jgi:hypothetical protein
MIDDLSNKGYALLSLPATVTSSGAGSDVFTFLLLTGAGYVNAPMAQMPQGRIAYILCTSAVTGSGSSITTIQTSPDNTNWTNVILDSGSALQFKSVTNSANTGGLQAIFKSVETTTGPYIRAYDNITGTVSLTRSVACIFIPKNP